MNNKPTIQRIFLIGYMGAGKTTLGRALAQEMNLTFIDLDNFIEGRQHKTISELFASVGEDGFRKLEHLALVEAATYEDVVISLGGGTPCFFDNMAIVKASGKSVYLKPDESVLLSRLIKAKQKRPVIAGKSDEELLSFIRENLCRREPYYQQADLVFVSDHIDNKAEIALKAKELAGLL